MAPLASAEQEPAIVGAHDAELLLDIAATTLNAALAGRAPARPDLAGLPPQLHGKHGVFVTLRVAGELNGCIGTVECAEPLGHAVARLALSAAFEDPRVRALRGADLPHLSIEISLLTPLDPLPAVNRDELLGSIGPGIDGLLIRGTVCHGVLLPSVWEALPDPDDFLDALWQKAGLPPRTWPRDLSAFRFATQHLARIQPNPGPGRLITS